MLGLRDARLAGASAKTPALSHFIFAPEGLRSISKKEDLHGLLEHGTQEPLLLKLWDNIRLESDEHGRATGMEARLAALDTYPAVANCRSCGKLFEPDRHGDDVCADC